MRGRDRLRPQQRPHDFAQGLELLLRATDAGDPEATEAFEALVEAEEDVGPASLRRRR
ncbi:MAG: hypothetical protein AB7N76_25900 [Planctomycetota bacterium]